MSAVVRTDPRRRPEETCGGNDLFYWPPGHSVRVIKNAEVALFSPQQEHMKVMDHMLKQMAAT